MLVSSFIEEEEPDMFNNPDVKYDTYLSSPAVYLASRGPNQNMIDNVAHGSIIVDPWGDDTSELEVPESIKIIRYGTQECFH